STSLPNVPPPPALGARVGTSLGSGSGRTTRRVARPTWLVPSQRTSTRYEPRRTVPLTWAWPRTQSPPALPVGAGVPPDGTGLSVTPLTNAREVAVAVWAGPPCGSGQLARIHTVELSPAVTRSGLSCTEILGTVGVAVAVAVVVAVAVAVAVVVGEAAGLPVSAGDPLGVGVCASAVQPMRPIMRMAPAYATRLTLSTVAPHSAALYQHPPVSWTPHS